MTIDFFYINKLSTLHDGKNIIFCKRDYILNEFQTISKLNNKVILITGNSDYPVTDELVNLAPKNIIKWYCQNALSNNPTINPIPIGMANKEDSYRHNHGIGYFDMENEKENIISSILDTIKPNKFMYANFSINTNINYRASVQKYIQNINYIDWQEPNLDFKTFFNTLVQYKMVLCPIGNGIDTHRLWETLYCNRIPITIKIGSYKIYELYEKLPIILLDKLEQLNDKNLIEQLYAEALAKQKKEINYLYWKTKIEQDQELLK